VAPWIVTGEIPMKHEIRLTERIRGPYEQVPPILTLEFDYVVREPLDELRVQVGDSSIGRRVHAEVGPMRTSTRTRDLPPRTLDIPLSWRAAEHPALFPTMRGTLRIRGAGRNTVELRLTGEYAPPLGVVGAVGDRLAGHEATTASLHRYLLEVASRLGLKLAEHAPPPAPRPSRSHHERSP